ncbi:MAG: SH3 domain-containing protein [Deltaproteobacteria bacterium]|nr:SH3 domain-containing protein [Deltaproteobacteria bacterium]
MGSSISAKGGIFGAMILAACLAPSSAISEPIKIDNIRNELLKSSLEKGKQGDTSSVSKNDLETADRRLKAVEQRIQQQAGLIEAPAPAFPEQKDAGKTAPAAALSGKPSSTAPSSVVPVKQVAPTGQTGNPQRASLDVQKVQPEVISGAPAVNPSIKIEGVSPPPPPPQVDQLVARNNQLEKELKAANEKANVLAKELDETRNRLMIAETQVERLSVIIESRQGKVPVNNTAGTSVHRSVPARLAPEPPSDAQIATVIADKVHLRTGPGKENSPLMAVTKGTRLTVETRSGDWYRVMAPTGRRAWVSADVVAFGLGSQTGYNNTSRVKGFDSGLNPDGESSN